MSGLGLCRSLRSEPRFDSVKLFLLSSITHQGSIRSDESTVCDAHLVKPLHRRPLCSALSRLFSTEPDKSQPPSATLKIASSSATSPSRSNARILLVEDNTINLMVAKGLLKKLGYTAKSVSCGEEALHALATMPFDLVLLDCQMPGMDGYEVATTIRSSPSTLMNSKISIIAMTANAMPGDREKCLDAGMDDYISKPVDPKALARKLGFWLHGSGSPVDDTPAPAAPGETILSIERLLERLDGDRDIVRDMLIRLPGILEEASQDLLRALSEGDPKATADALHLLRSMTGNTDCDAMAGLLASLEEDLPDLDRISERLPAFQAIKTTTLHAIRSWLTSA